MFFVYVDDQVQIANLDDEEVQYASMFYPDSIYFEASLEHRLPQNIEQYEVAWKPGRVQFKFMDWFGDGDSYEFGVDTAEKILIGLTEAIRKAKEKP